MFVQKFAELRVFRGHVPYVPTCPKFLRAYVPTCLYIFFVPTCLYPLNYFVHKCPHFSRTNVPTTTQDIGNDIYPTDVKSDEN